MKLLLLINLIFSVSAYAESEVSKNDTQTGIKVISTDESRSEIKTIAPGIKIHRPAAYRSSHRKSGRSAIRKLQARIKAKERARKAALKKKADTKNEIH